LKLGYTIVEYTTLQKKISVSSENRIHVPHFNIHRQKPGNP